MFLSRDTAGQERFAPLGSMYYHGAKVGGVRVTVTDRSSRRSCSPTTSPGRAPSRVCPPGFTSLTTGTKVRVSAPPLDVPGVDCAKVVVGCKADLEEARQVSVTGGRKAAEELGARWWPGLGGLPRLRPGSLPKYFCNQVERNELSKRIQH